MEVEVTVVDFKGICNIHCINCTCQSLKVLTLRYVPSRALQTVFRLRFYKIGLILREYETLNFIGLYTTLLLDLHLF